MVAVQVAFPVKLGLMRVILKMLESVQGELRVQHPARELICKYMTEEHACSLVMAAAASTAGDGTQALHLLPAAFQLVAFSVSLRALSATSCDAKSGERAPQGGDRDLTPLLSEVYCPVWSSVSASSASSVQVRSALAKSLVQIFRGAVQSVRYSFLVVFLLAACIKCIFCGS